MTDERLPLSACIDVLFAEDGVGPADRIRRAAGAGVVAVEFWLWRKKDVDGIAMALQETGLHLTSFMSEHKGLRTITEQLVDPRQHEAFLQGLADSLALARRLNCSVLVVHSGDSLPGVSPESQHAAVVTALRRAAPLAAQADVRLLLEPLNTAVDHPGHFLSGTAEGLDIVDEVGHPNVALLYDLYHSVSMGEVPSEVLVGRVDRVGHVQLADAPGRHEPGTGRVDWPRMLGWLRSNGYRGLWGLEYFPSVDSAASLAYVADLVSSIARGGEPRLAGRNPAPGG
jgi:hydroxypyruvate isomerase